MSPSRAPTSVAPLLALILAVPLAAASGSGATAAAGRMPAAPAPVLVRSAAGWSVEWNGRSERLALPADVGLGRVSAFGSGWIISGGRQDDDRLEMYLLLDAGKGPVELPPPGNPVGRVREGAVPIAIAGGPAPGDARLAGVAWLEGDGRRSYSVRWAGWLGTSFLAPVEISPRGPGSQLALAGTALADGRVVLVWSGFDGLDDEIWASVGDGTRWTPPARVGADNAVPDVTPDVIADGRGALVAWSRYDGDEYRVRLARLAGDRFEELDAEGPGGSLAPTFAGGAPGPLLLWRDARADDWALGEVAEAGRLVARAHAAGPADERPAVVVADGRAWFRFATGPVASDWR